MLQIINVKKSFGGVHALRSVDMELIPGKLTSVIGPNGAGKSSLMNVISGFTKPTAGDVLLDARTLLGLPPHEMCGLGIARTFQNLQMFSHMPAWEVAASGCFRLQSASRISDLLGLPSSRAEMRRSEERAHELLDFVAFEQAWRERRAGDLPYGLQRKLEISRALATSPKWLLLDEPAAGLNTAETAALGKLLKKISSTGVSLVLIEHDLDLVLEISDEVYVMDAGSVIARGGPAQIREDPKVIAAYIGADSDE
ncbi:ABC transporter ATP-binding protein [Chelatococcus asaccharovorans]|uniref:Branched-chain amino acid transport system ATP-binding protein n=1 Tax=Chelatococcus asaccharovorans TaxID=28210 RepID=A0A2V3TTG6_9HYPH|nr:ABC transporter ATP-binding protein [Chelatococcus asaccharovorans]MBS7707828.1 ABC transporter ATP-binding protein [Chelatococcus asaccharovorans]PXW50925.1 branched-chain amino acid transport system ATP-binding protein [Chelatococcus asaccharovorans]